MREAGGWLGFWCIWFVPRCLRLPQSEFASVAAVRIYLAYYLLSLLTVLHWLTNLALALQDRLLDCCRSTFGYVRACRILIVEVTSALSCLFRFENILNSSRQPWRRRPRATRPKCHQCKKSNRPDVRMRAREHLRMRHVHIDINNTTKKMSRSSGTGRPFTTSPSSASATLRLRVSGRP